ncbi:MAG: hypothetical protein J6T15_03555 [Bacilli bacterium]|jgi:hypothetical protein|nr:hypothetical protein [Bacilli bacterium]
MKKYILEAIVNGEYVRIKKVFSSRTEAINYVFRYYDNHNLVNLRVNEEYCINGNKHDIAYVYDYYNRFRIARA